MGVSTTHRINLSMWILIYSFSDTYYVWAACVVVKYRHRAIVLLFLMPEWALSQSMRLKAEWAIDLEAMRARGIIVLVKSSWLVKNIDNKNILAS